MAKINPLSWLLNWLTPLVAEQHRSPFHHIIRGASYLIVALIVAYRYLISPILGSCCRFEPSCSRYAQTAMLRFGICRGTYLSLKRILRCHPWRKGGWDPVPDIEQLH